MDKNAIHLNSENIKNIENISNEILFKEFYRSQRYKIVSTICLVKTNTDIEISDLKKHIRILDELVQIEKNLYLLIFSYTNIEKSYKATQNLLTYMKKENHLFDASIALEEYQKNDKNHLNIVRRLVNILNTIEKNNHHTEHKICTNDVMGQVIVI